MRKDPLPCNERPILVEHNLLCAETGMTRKAVCRVRAGSVTVHGFYETRAPVLPALQTAFIEVTQRPSRGFAAETPSGRRPSIHGERRTRTEVWPAPRSKGLAEQSRFDGNQCPTSWFSADRGQHRCATKCLDSHSN